MWRDESVTYQVAHRSLSDIGSLLGNIDAVHGLYYLIMHGVFALWDGGLVALRAPSVIAAAVAAAGVGALGRHLRGTRAGVLAGSAYPAIPMVQHFAQEGRSYALVSATVVWACYVFVRCIDNGSTRLWVAYTSLVVVAGWLHEFAVLVLVAHAATLLVVDATRPTKQVWLICAAAVTVAVVPLAVVSVGQSDEQLGWLGGPTLAMWLQFFAVSAAGLAMSCYGARATAPRSASSTSRLALPSVALPLLVLPGGLLLTVSLLEPWYVDRYVLYSMAGFALLLGSATDRLLGSVLSRSTRGRITAFCLAAAGLASLLPWALLIRSPESRKDDAVAVAEAVEAYAHRGDAVLFMPARRREWLLSAPAVYREIDDLALDITPAESGTLQGVERTAATIRSRMLHEDRIISLSDPSGQPLDPFPEEVVKRQMLKEYFERCARKKVHGAQISVYARPGQCD
ncbi:glycosyltransferase family 39 protein [Streptomyces coelicoflavus]|uniref:glycosyltransferase family 39 protein n=1 Tax=Streptomyces coelicoflavus TaxID=285562 RepID=UPI0024AE7723|nr:glycosyltransferase family 39 protein [Streptomyces coelicoflavus]MDI6519067.1 glycosyltransferase family 39 protein [Streptomyces coelicoflavus]